MSTYVELSQGIVGVSEELGGKVDCVFHISFLRLQDGDRQPLLFEYEDIVDCPCFVN